MKLMKQEENKNRKPNKKNKKKEISSKRTNLKKKSLLDFNASLNSLHGLHHLIISDNRL